MRLNAVSIRILEVLNFEAHFHNIEVCGMSADDDGVPRVRRVIVIVKERGFLANFAESFSWLAIAIVIRRAMPLPKMQHWALLDDKSQLQATAVPETKTAFLNLIYLR